MKKRYFALLSALILPMLNGCKDNQIFKIEYLNSLQGNLKLVGGYTLQYEGEEQIYKNKIEVTYTANSFYAYEIAEDGTTYEEEVFRHEDGKPYIYYRLLDNTIEYSLAGYDENNDGINEIDYHWSDFDNPFNSLTTENFNYVSKGIYALDKTLAKDVATDISRWNESIAKFEVVIEKNEVIGIDFTTNPISVAGSIYTSIYHFDVEKRGAELTDRPIPTPYPRTENHQDLADALKEIKEKSHTISHLDVSDDGHISYNYQFTSEAIFCDANFPSQGIVPSGYVNLNGTVYEFTFNDQVLSKGDFISSSIADLSPMYEGFIIEFLEDKGGGLFEAYDSSIAAFIAPYFGEDYNNQMVASYATSLSVFLENGHLKEVKYHYNILGQISGDVTMTYSNIGSTIINIDFSSLLAGEIGIPQDHIGTYKSADGLYTLVVTETTLTLNDILLEYRYYAKDQSYTFAYLDYQFTLFYEVGNFQLYLNNAPYAFLIKDSVEEETDTPLVSIPITHYGTFANNDQTYTLIVGKNGLTLNDELLTFSYNMNYQSYSFEYDNKSWELSYETAYAEPFFFLICSDEGLYIQLKRIV